MATVISPAHDGLAGLTAVRVAYVVTQLHHRWLPNSPVVYSTFEIRFPS